MWHARAQRLRKLGRRLADQIGLSDAREIFGETRDAADFGLSARDPENIRKRGQRMRRRVGIGAFRIIDEQHVAAPADLLHAVREPWKTAQALLQDFTRATERERASRGAGRVLRVVQATKRADAADPRDL